MAELYVVRHFQWDGRIYRSGEQLQDAVLTVPDAVIAEEKKLGKHPKTKNWMSPLLNHCVPADDAAEALLEEKAPPVPKADKADSPDEIAKIQGKFDAAGKAYSPRWELKRLKTEWKKVEREIAE